MDYKNLAKKTGKCAAGLAGADKNDLDERKRLKEIFWHESKSPLTGMPGYVELCLGSNLTPNQRDRFQIIGDNATKIIDYADTFRVLESENGHNDNIRDTYWNKIKNHLLNLEINLENLKKEKLGEDLNLFFDSIYKSFKRVKKNYGLSKLKNLSSEELKKYSSRFDLECLANETVEEFQDHLNNTNIKLNLDFQGDNYFFGHSDSIHSMLTTLLGNSINFTPEYSTINVKMKNKNGKLILTTRNQYMEKSREMHGTNKGLGTPYVKDLTENLGGDFSAKKGLGYFRTRAILKENI